MGARECLKNGPENYCLLWNIGRTSKSRGPPAFFPRCVWRFVFVGFETLLLSLHQAQFFVGAGVICRTTVF